MKIALTDLGERLQQLRKSLDLSQSDLATTLQVGQNLISRLENGLGGSLDVLLLLINFYSDHFQLYSLFSEQFEVIKKSDAVSQMSTFTSIAVERLKFIQTDLGQQITDVIDILEKEGSY